MKHPEFYKRDGGGKITYPYDWFDIAALNYNSKELRQYMTDMLKFWIREFDLDGFRCDVAGEVPTDFWENARIELERVKPDIFMLAEAHKAELLVKAFDADYSWPLHSALTDVLQGRKGASEIRAAWEAERKEWRFGERAALAASALTFTLDGVPLLYNGMEVGDTTESGAPALFEKLPIFWPVAERRPEFPRFYKQIMALRNESSAARRGSLEWLRNSDESRVLTYLRRTKNEEMLVAINLSSKPFFGLVETAGVTGYVDITPDVGPPLPPDAPAPAQAVTKRNVGLPALSLEAWGYRMFRRPL